VYEISAEGAASILAEGSALGTMCLVIALKARFIVSEYPDRKDS